MKTVRMYKGNRIDRAYEQPLDELAQKFKGHEAWANVKAGWPLDRGIALFLGDRESNGGLDAAYDMNDYAAIRKAIRDGLSEEDWK